MPYTPNQMASAINNLGVAILQNKTVIPTSTTQTITPDNNYDGLNSVIVQGDNNLAAKNIAKDVNIFGVTGTYNPDEDWVRPSDWPNLDSLALPNNNTTTMVYMTYILDRVDWTPWIGITDSWATHDKNGMSLQRGHIENNEFIIDEDVSTQINGKNAKVITLDPNNGNIQLWRYINLHTPNISNQFGFCGNENGLTNNLQPCVEIYGVVQNSHIFYGSETTSTLPNLTLSYLERIKLKIDNGSSQMPGLSSCYNLKSFDFNGSNFSGSNNSLQGGIFTNDYKLKTVDLSNIIFPNNILEVPRMAPPAAKTINFGNVQVRDFYSNQPLAVENFYIQKILKRHQYGFTISNLPKLTTQSLLNILNALDTLENETDEIKFGVMNLAKVTEEQIAIATEKGWTITT